MNTVEKALELRNRYNEETLCTALYEVAVDDYAGIATDFYSPNADDEQKADLDREFLYADIEFVIHEIFDELEELIEEGGCLSAITSRFIGSYYQYLCR